MKRKRYLCFVIAAVCAVSCFLLAGCGDNDTTTDGWVRPKNNISYRIVTDDTDPDHEDSYFYVYICFQLPENLKGYKYTYIDDYGEEHEATRLLRHYIKETGPNRNGEWEDNNRTYYFDELCSIYSTYLPEYIHGAKGDKIYLYDDVKNDIETYTVKFEYMNAKGEIKTYERVIIDRT